MLAPRARLIGRRDRGSAEVGIASGIGSDMLGLVGYGELKDSLLRGFRMEGMDATRERQTAKQEKCVFNVLDSLKKYFFVLKCAHEFGTWLQAE